MSFLDSRECWVYALKKRMLGLRSFNNTLDYSPHIILPKILEKLFKNKDNTFV